MVSPRTGRAALVDDLRSLDPELHRHLMSLKRDTSDVAALDLDFTVTHSGYGRTQTHELLPGGSAMAVDGRNKIRYVHLMVRTVARRIAVCLLTHRRRTTC